MFLVDKNIQYVGLDYRCFIFKHIFINWAIPTLFTFILVKIKN